MIPALSILDPLFFYSKSEMKTNLEVLLPHQKRKRKRKSIFVCCTFHEGFHAQLKGDVGNWRLSLLLKTKSMHWLINNYSRKSCMDLVEEFVGMKQSIQISDWFMYVFLVIKICFKRIKNMFLKKKIVNKEHISFLSTYSMNVSQVDEPHNLIWSIIIGNEDRIVSIG